jgi:primosomal protein N' (replication factor Y)
MPSQCGNCGSTRLVTRGFGTELVEDEIEIILPGVRVGRLDLDTSRSRYGYERILEDFGSGKLDILVGTQMLSKGLDFERVSLVGILSADQMLNFPDFRAFERSYQLMAQVSGRAGRKADQGKVIIQCSDPSHPIIQYVLKNDFAGMYKDQVYERQTFSYPPFVKLIKFVLRGKDPRELAKAAEVMGEKMQAIFGRRVLGPQIPLVGRVKGWYLQQIMLKIEKKASFSRARNLITELIRELENEESFKKVRLNIDVDPA